MYCLGCWANLPDSASICSKCGRDPRVRVAVGDAGGSVEPRNRDRASGAPLSGSRPSGAPASGAPASGAPAAAGPAAAIGRVQVALEAAVEADAPARGPAVWLRIVALGLAAGLSAGGALVLLGRREPPAPAAAGDGSSRAVRVAVGDGALPPIDVALPDLPADVVADAGRAQALYQKVRAAYDANDYEAASALLRDAVASAPEADRPPLVRALAAARQAAGAQALAAGDPDRAVATLLEAVELNPGSGTAWKSLGAARLAVGDVPAAIESLGKAVEILPRDVQARYLLATVLYREGQTAAAVEHLRAAAAVAPGDLQVRALLAKAQTEHAVESDYKTADSQHFAVTFEGGGTSEQAGYLVSLLLEDAYHAVGRQLDHYPRRPVHAVLYPAESFHDVTQSPTWAGALFDGKIRMPVGGLTERTPLLARVLAHEYTHALVHDLADGRAPVWLNEGLAQLSEGPDDGLLERFRSYLRGGGQVPSLQALEGSFGHFNSAQAEFAYAMSLAATDYLVRSYGHAAARRILERLGKGEALADAIQATLHMSYSDLDRAWVGSLR